MPVCRNLAQAPGRQQHVSNYDDKAVEYCAALVTRVLFASLQADERALQALVRG